MQLAMQFLDFERDAAGPVRSPATSMPPPPTRRRPPTRCATSWRPASDSRSGLPGRCGTSSPTPWPSRVPAAPPYDTVRGILTQLSDVEKARQPVVDGAVAAPARSRWLGHRSAPPSMPLVGSVAHSTPRSSPRRPRPPAPTTASSARRSSRCGRRWRSAPGPNRRGSNAFSLARFARPDGRRCRSPIDSAIQAAADEVRSQSRGASLATLAAVTTALPTSLVTRLARQQSQTIDFATSNVKGSPVPVFIAGASSCATTRSGRWPAWPST